MSRKLIAGNWKMNGDRAQWRELATAVAHQSANISADFVVFPPAVGVADVADVLADSAVAWGAQDVSAHTQGAHTGEVSADMLKDFGCRYALAGHSERRADLGETDAMVAAKAAACLAQGVVPIVCIGETDAQKSAGKTVKVLDGQLQGSLHSISLTSAEDLVIAYEPVWAIGTGHVPTLEEIASVAAHIRRRLKEVWPSHGQNVKILYGGSVKPENAAEILSTLNVDGALIGGASLKAESFVGIAKAAI